MGYGGIWWKKRPCDWRTCEEKDGYGIVTRHTAAKIDQAAFALSPNTFFRHPREREMRTVTTFDVADRITSN